MKDKYICFDIETTGLNGWVDKITCICAVDSEGKKFSDYNPNEKEMISNFLNWLNDRPKEEYFFISKNGKLFDIPFIMATLAMKGPLDNEHKKLLEYEHFDLQEITYKWIGLNDMAKLLKCKTKNGLGKDAIKLAKEGKFDELIEYCMNDVYVTEAVYHKYKML